MKILSIIQKKIIISNQYLINFKNRKRLINKKPTLICSNCTGGVLYKWLGLKFNSPFINLYMDNEDFLTALENFDNFVLTEIKEDKDSDKNYPVGIGFKDVKIHFMHYPDFKNAKEKWDERKRRIDKNNMGIMLTNFGEGLIGEGGEIAVIQRFNSLDFKNKIIFTDKNYNLPNTFHIRNYNKKDLVFSCKSKFGKRLIDQFDYVKFINTLKNQ